MPPGSARSRLSYTAFIDAANLRVLKVLLTRSRPARPSR